MKIIVPVFFLSLLLSVSCTRRFSCECDYTVLSYADTTIVNAAGNDTNVVWEYRTPDVYRSSIAYTSKKLANEECDERGRSLGLDTLHVDISCSISKE